MGAKCLNKKYNLRGSCALQSGLPITYITATHDPIKWGLWAALNCELQLKNYGNLVNIRWNEFLVEGMR